MKLFGLAAITEATLKGRALFQASVVENPHRRYVYDCGFRLAGLQNRSGLMGSALPPENWFV